MVLTKQEFIQLSHQDKRAFYDEKLYQNSPDPLDTWINDLISYVDVHVYRAINSPAIFKDMLSKGYPSSIIDFSLKYLTDINKEAVHAAMTFPISKDIHNKYLKPKDKSLLPLLQFSMQAMEYGREQYYIWLKFARKDVYATKPILIDHLYDMPAFQIPMMNIEGKEGILQYVTQLKLNDKYKFIIQPKFMEWIEPMGSPARFLALKMPINLS